MVLSLFMIHGNFWLVLRLLLLALLLSFPAISDAGPQVYPIDKFTSNAAGAVVDIRTAFTSGMPLAAEWNIGQTGRGWTLTNQVELIRQGYRILPTIYNPLPNPKGNSQRILDKWLEQNRGAIEQLREWKLPICLRTTNWLGVLTAKPPSKYRVPFERMDESPLAWRLDENGEPDDMPIADPMGPVSRWQEMGHDVATSLWVKTIAKIYPDPPLIYFLENNEGSKLKAETLYLKVAGFQMLPGQETLQEKSLRFADHIEKIRQGDSPLPDLDDTKLLFADLYVEKYQAFTKVLKEQAPEAWRGRIVVGGYGGASTYRGRAHKPWSPDLVFDKYGFSTNIHYWDIVSPSAYINHWDNSWDNWIKSPQIQAMSLGLMFRDFANRDPNWFAEISIWSGAPKRHWAMWKKRDQVYTPERYKGYAQQILWQSRIKGRGFVLRQFDGYRTDPSDPVLSNKQFGQLPEGSQRYTYGDYWMSVADSVRAVYENETLRRFWLEGEPVVNPDPAGHYFKWDLPEGMMDDRWQLLDSDANPPRSEWPKKLGVMDLRVYAIAYRMPGDGGEYLVYAWSPEGGIVGVGVEVPGVGVVEIDTAVGGRFYLVEQTDKNRE